MDICPYCGDREDVNMPHGVWCCFEAYEADRACSLLERSDVDHNDTWMREAMGLVGGYDEE